MNAQHSPPPRSSREQKADYDLSRRSMSGGLVYLGFVALLVVVTDYGQVRPVALAIVTVLSVVCATSRLLLGFCFERMRQYSAKLWRALLWVSVGVTALTWGLFLAASVLWFGYYDWKTLILLVCMAGTAPVSLASFTPSMPLLVVFQVLFCAPMIVANAYNGGVTGYSLAAIFFWYMGFMLLYARRLNSEYRASMDREEIQLARRAAEEANRAKSELLAQISHEIRTPLNTIIGMAYLATNTQHEARRREYLETTQESAEFLVRLLNELLDASKMDAGRLLLECHPFDPRRMVQGVVTAFQADAERKGLSLSCQMGPDVPPSVTGDQGRVRQVLVNVLSNAIKFTESGQVDIRLEKGEPVGGATVLCFSVSDTGIGIAPERHEAIFEPFEQGNPSTYRRHGGTGLGLAICSRLVALMGGTISVESEPGSGSVFRWSVSLPEALAPDTGSDHAAPAPTESSTGARILVVEDNPTSQVLMRRLLEHRHHSVRIVSSGSEALDVFEGEPFDLILMDVQLPEMDGLETTAAVRRKELETGRCTPIIALTANAGKREREKCLLAGMNGYLAKPVDPEELYRVIDQFTVPAK